MTPELQRYLVPRPPASVFHRKVLEGKYLRFEAIGWKVGEPAFSVNSRRGGFAMGRVEFSPQWRAWMFRSIAVDDAIFPMSAVAEIYAFMKGLGGRQV